MLRHLNPIVKNTGIALVSGMILLAGCIRPQPSHEPLLEADLAFAQATARKGVEGFKSFLAEDVATLRPDQPVIRGKDAVAARWATLLNNSALSIRWRPLEAAIAGAGDLGYTIGSYEITRTDGQEKQIVGTGKYVTIWRKQRDGSWKVAFDSGVQDTPRAAAEKK